jgi:transcriptional regulator GlxA family with amidase domain
MRPYEVVSAGPGSPGHRHGASGANGGCGVRNCAGDRRDLHRSRCSAPPVPAHDQAKPTAVIVLSLHGTNVTDTLAPYEVLASTGAFNLYTVAERREPVPLTGGVDLIPDLSFGQLADRLHRAPDVIIIPELHDAGEPSASPVIEWLQCQHVDGAPLMVSVCVGAEVLASAGLLDGRPATSHWLGLIGHRRNYPAVHWGEFATSMTAK